MDTTVLEPMHGRREWLRSSNCDLVEKLALAYEAYACDVSMIRIPLQTDPSDSVNVEQAIHR